MGFHIAFKTKSEAIKYAKELRTPAGSKASGIKYPSTVVVRFVKSFSWYSQKGAWCIYIYPKDK